MHTPRPFSSILTCCSGTRSPGVTTIAAMRSAALLCASMGESFSTEGDGGDEVQQSPDLKENARTLEFDNCTGGILDGFIKLYMYWVHRAICMAA